MGVMEALRRALQAHEDQRAAQLDSELAELVWRIDPPRDRIIRNRLVPLGTAYEMSGSMFTDGLARLVVNPSQHLAPETLARYLV